MREQESIAYAAQSVRRTELWRAYPVDVRFLVLEHHFAQDIEALQSAADGIELDVISYELLYAEALRVLPERVADGLEAFTDPLLARARARYAAILCEILQDRFTSRPFDAVVVPSDTFFYVRAAPAIAHSLGVPFLVAQKETTISENTLREHAQRIRRYAPPLADRMTVCSERHRRFWLRAGGAEQDIVVTGQPRFDYYSRPPQSADRGGSGDRPTALFLSYAVDAYHPAEGGGEPVWRELHRQTERGLRELASRGWRVLIKPHPQQPLDLLEAWRRDAADLWGRQLFVVDAQADVRGLIVAADVVVGFQSTAMLEAMLAGRPVLYTGWDPTATALERELIPFSRWGREIIVLRSAEDLPEAANTARLRKCSADVLRARREIAEGYLGPLDGRAAQRTVAAMRQTAEEWAARRGAPERALRAQLERRRSPLRLRRRTRSWARLARRRVGAALGR